jgi:hypothetical protein
VKPGRYTSVPVTIEAMRWTGENSRDVIDWIVDNGGAVQWTSGEPQVLEITTLEGDMSVSLGGWIILGTEGEFYPCKDSVFRRRYREAE